MKSLIKFEYKRFIGNKSSILLIGSCIFTFILSIILNKSTLQSNVITNYYIVLAQFTFIFFIPMVSLYGFSNDYEKKIFPFYFQNNITLFQVYIARNIVLVLASVGIYIISIGIYICIYRLNITVEFFYSFILLISVLIYDIQIILFLSILCRKTTTCMMLGIFFWISVHIIGLFTNNIDILSGKISIIDGNSYYANFFKNYEQKIVVKLGDFLQCISTGAFWIIALILICSILLLLKKKFKIYL